MGDGHLYPFFFLLKKCDGNLKLTEREGNTTPQKKKACYINGSGQFIRNTILHVHKWYVSKVFNQECRSPRGVVFRYETTERIDDKPDAEM